MTDGCPHKSIVAYKYRPHCCRWDSINRLRLVLQPLNMIKLLSAISLFGTLANIAHAQTTITTTLNGQPTTLELGYFIQPSGVQKVRGSFSDSTPLVCTSVCYAIETVYGYAHPFHLSCFSISLPSHVD